MPPTKKLRRYGLVSTLLKSAVLAPTDLRTVTHLALTAATDGGSLADSGSLYLVVPEGSTTRLEFYLKLKWTMAGDAEIFDRRESRQFPYFDRRTGGVAYRALRDKKAQMWNGDIADRNYKRFSQGPQLKSLMCVPVVYAGDVRAVLSIHNKQRTVRFVDSDLDFVQDVSNAVAITLTANYSDLTNMPNRRLMDALIQREIQEAQASRASLSLVFLDLDHFGKLNRAHGWINADQVLKQFADRIRRASGRGNTVCHRHGDEFAIICPSRGINEARGLAEDVLVRMRSSPFTIRKADDKTGEMVAIEQKQTASMGVATFREDN